MHVSELPWRDKRLMQVEARVLLLPPGIEATVDDFEARPPPNAKPKPENYHDLDTAVDGAVRLQEGNGLSPWILVEDIILTPDEVIAAFHYRHPNR